MTMTKTYSCPTCGHDVPLKASLRVGRAPA